MDILYTILCTVIVLGVLVFVHEGGHYVAARAFGVRVTEFMIGLPGPNIGFVKNGTKFGVTLIPLGGYAKVCGMETGPMSKHLEDVLGFVYSKGIVFPGDVARGCNISDEEAHAALEELVEWGSIVQVETKGVDLEAEVARVASEGLPLLDPEEFAEIFATPERVPSKKEVALARRLCLPDPVTYAIGDPRPALDNHAFFESERSQQYRYLPFWKRSVILLAGIAVNLIFAVLAMVVVYSVIGVDCTLQSGEVYHFRATLLQSIQVGFEYIAMTFQAILGLFNPQTAAQTVSDSTSIVGIAVISAEAFSRGLVDGIFFMAAISVSLGLMNLLPIPSLDGGRFLIEIVQKVSGRDVPMKAVGYMSMAGMALLLCFFVFMLNQDIQRFVFGNW